MNLVLEINGKNAQRITVTDTGVTIGRSWTNDIIVKDRYVDSNQLILYVHEGQLHIEDLESTNGTEVAGKHISGGGNAYRYGDNICIGDTVLSLQEVDTPVEKTSKRSFVYKVIRYFKPTLILSLLMVSYGSLVVFSDWLLATERFGFIDGLSAFFKDLSVVLVVAACFAIFNKLIKGYSSMREHIIIVLFIAFFEKVVEFMIWVVRFNLQQATVGEWMPVALSFITTVLIFVGGLSYITYLGKAKIWFFSMCVALGFLYKAQSGTFSKEDHERWSQYSDTENIAFPPAYLLRNPISVEDYFENSDYLFKLAEEEE